MDKQIMAGKNQNTNYDVTGTVYLERFSKQEIEAFSLDPPFPEDCMVELTNVCNHECVFCTNPRMKRKPTHLSLNLFKDFISEAARLGCKEIGFYSTGEPFVTSNLDAFVQAARVAGISYLYISTNGALATPQRAQKAIEAGLNSIKFSINAATRESYKLVHGRDDFEKVLENVRWIYEYKKKYRPNLRLLGSCVLTRSTEKERVLHQEMFGKYFEDIVYVNASVQAGQAELEAKIVTPSFHKIEYPPEGTMKPCFMLWKRVHLTAEGYLTLCCVDYENNLTYAQVDDGQDLMTHWHNSIITEMRQRHLKQELKGTLCHKCFYGGAIPYKPISSLHSQLEKNSNDNKGRHLQERLDTIQSG